METMTTQTLEPVDEQLIEATAGRLFDLYTSGLLTYMVDIGHRTGLLEAAAVGPATSEELAARAGLHERYVREWAAALATGRILDYDAATRRYRLPAEYAACLTGSGASNLAPVSQIGTLLATHVAAVAAAFREGGGVPADAYRPEFTAVMDALGRGIYDELLIDAFLPLTGELPSRLAAGIRVADIGCGTGHCINLMAAAYPASQFVGYDLSAEAVELARSEADAYGLQNATFDVLDAVALPTEPGYGAVFAFDAIHDMPDPAGVLRRVQEALVPGGWFVMVDPKASSNVEDNIGNPLAPLLYSISTLYCMTVSLAAGGVGLGTAYGEQAARQLLADAGFVDVAVFDAPSDPTDSIYVCRTSS
jgi:SAM-dependent methyltransferase